jgi:hypothetical protein
MPTPMHSHIVAELEVLGHGTSHLLSADPAVRPRLEWHPTPPGAPWNTRRPPALAIIMASCFHSCTTAREF